MTLITYSSRPLWSLLDSPLSGEPEYGWFTGQGSQFGYVRYPLVNVWDSGEDVVVEAELPGVDPRKVEVTLKDDELTISGDRVAEEVQANEIIHRKERGSGSFSRSVRLPYRGEADKVAATYRHGILRVTVPRAQSDKPYKVKVEAA